MARKPATSLVASSRARSISRKPMRRLLTRSINTEDSPSRLARFNKRCERSSLSASRRSPLSRRFLNWFCAMARSRCKVAISACCSASAIFAISIKGSHSKLWITTDMENLVCVSAELSYPSFKLGYFQLQLTVFLVGKGQFIADGFDIITHFIPVLGNAGI